MTMLIRSVLLVISVSASSLGYAILFRWDGPLYERMLLGGVYGLIAVVSLLGFALLRLLDERLGTTLEKVGRRGP